MSNKILKPTRGRPKAKMMPIMNNNYLNVNELADMLKMSVSHIYTLTSTKKIPHIKVLGKKVLFDKSQIEQWLKSKMVVSE